MSEQISKSEVVMMHDWRIINSSGMTQIIADRETLKQLRTAIDAILNDDQTTVPGFTFHANGNPHSHIINVYDANYKP